MLELEGMGLSGTKLGGRMGDFGLGVGSADLPRLLLSTSHTPTLPVSVSNLLRGSKGYFLHGLAGSHPIY